jgi:hypothetical protein
MRLVLVGLLVLGPGLTGQKLDGPNQLPPQPGPQQTPRQHRPVFVRELFNAGAAIKAAASSGWGLAFGRPYEWGGGPRGFGIRFASAYGTHMIRMTIKYPIARALHEEIVYEPSGLTRFGPRMKYALLSTVITQKTTSKKRTVAVGSIAGTVGGGLLSRFWHPHAYSSVSSGFASAGISFGTQAGMNAVREFWPEIRHLRRHSNRNRAETEPAKR